MTIDLAEKLQKRIDEDIIPAIEANKEDLKIVKPLVLSHDIVLHGKREDRKDEGLVGVINNIEEHLRKDAEAREKRTRWLVGFGTSLLVIFLSFLGSVWYAMYLFFINNSP